MCVVDAEAGGGQLARHEEARAQVEAADRILLTKLDLAPAEAVVALHRELARRNPAAERASFPDGDEGAAALVPGCSTCAGAPRVSRADRHAHAHGQLVVVTFTDPDPLLAEPLLAVIDGLGAALVRAKGFVHLAGDGRRGFLERAGARTGLATRRALGQRAAAHRAGADWRRPRRRRHPPPDLGLPQQARLARAKRDSAAT